MLNRHEIGSQTQKSSGTGGQLWDTMLNNQEGPYPWLYKFADLIVCTTRFKPNSEGVPATHLSEGGGHIVPPPGKCSINGPNELKFCVWPHMGCVWEIPWPKRYNHVSGSRLSPRSKNPKISGILKFGYIFHFFLTKLTSKNPKTLPIEFLVKKWSILM